MEVTNIRKLIYGSLKDLTTEKLADFRVDLREWKGDDTRLRRADVEDKSPLELSELLVEKFCKDGVVTVTKKLLEDIGCMQTAVKLAEEAAGVLQAAPTETDSPPPPAEEAAGVLQAAPTETDSPPPPESRPVSRSCTQALATRSDANVQSDANVRSDANARSDAKVQSDADVQSELSRKQLMFGKYKEKSFEWLLQNDPNYAVYVAATHLKEREDGNSKRSEQMTNKDDLVKYVKLFLDVWRDVHFYKEGLAPVGFGKCSKLTREDLYSSTEESKKSYVRWMLQKEGGDNDPRLDAAVKFFQYRKENPDLYRLVCPTPKKKKRTPSGTRRGRPAKKRC